MQNDIARQLLDGKGQLKSYEQFLRDVAPLTGKYCDQWLNTEYNTAVIRAHRAADWKHFETEKDVYPNLRWMPTTSAEPDPVHMKFWSSRLTLPVDDPFWDHHHPGERWGCKCTCEQTDEPVNDLGVHDDIPDTASKGLHGNPGQTGKLFSEDHPYYTDSYNGAKKAVLNTTSKIKKHRTPEDEENIRRRWVERKQINKIVKEWASQIPANDIRNDAENAARIILRTFGKDIGLPRIVLKDLGGKTKRGITKANYSSDIDVLRININKAALKAYKQNDEEWGWVSQNNTILHELSHRLHSKYDSRFYDRSMQDVLLNRSYIKQHLSEYALTSRAEYEAELISGILSGKKYPDKIIAQSVFARSNSEVGKILIKKGRDLSPESVQLRRDENRKLAKELESWYKERLPETRLGGLTAKRFKVERIDGDEIIVNKTFYNEIISKYKDDLFYSDRLDKAKIAHNLIKDAKYIGTEKPEHEKHINADEVFKVYERTYDDTVYEFKVKVTSDEQILYYMKIK